MSYELSHGEALDVLRAVPDCCVDSVVMDPPYGLGFMGKDWDSFRRSHNPADVGRDDVFGRASRTSPASYTESERDGFVAFMQPIAVEMLRVLKPGGHLLSFGGTRTYHWLAWAIEGAGFEIRDMIEWLYGCLSEDTEVLIDGRWEPYREAIEGRHALCYDTERDEFSWRPIQETFVYDYDDIAFRLRSDHTDQIVSRAHRCLVERGGGYAFVRAETLEREARVPVVEDVRGLLRALPLRNEGASGEEEDVRGDVPLNDDLNAHYRDGNRTSGRPDQADVSRLQENVRAQSQGHSRERVVLLERVQRSPPRAGVGQACTQGSSCVGTLRGSVVQEEDVRAEQPGMEGRGDVLQDAREIQGRPLRPVPVEVPAHGEEGRLRHGAPADRREGPREVPLADGSRASRRPRPDEQREVEPHALREQSGPQAVRGARFARPDLARVERTHYRGKVWCIRVPTGAFMVRRNGKVFVTGNSGFPKSLSVSKAFDKAAGVEPLEVRPATLGMANNPQWNALHNQVVMPEATTDHAKQWEGWGTALKPAHEPILVGRKPLQGTVIENVAKWGTGAINVDGCRVACEGGSPSQQRRETAQRTGNVPTNPGMQDGSVEGRTSMVDRTSPERYMEQREGESLGRFPANVILSHDPRCVEIGTRDVKANGSIPEGKTYVANNNVFGQRQDITEGWQPYGNGDGTETVEEWACVPGCAVRILDDQSGTIKSGKPGKRRKPHETQSMAGTLNMLDRIEVGYADSGGASRFFYCAKPAKSEKNVGAEDIAWHNPETGKVSKGNVHPTCKPVALMRYLCRLVTPPGGIVLDPFMGSGTTGVAAIQEGFNFAGIERDPRRPEDVPSFHIARARIEHAARKLAEQNTQGGPS